MTRRIVRHNGLTIALVLIVVGLLCSLGVTYAGGGLHRSAPAAHAR